MASLHRPRDAPQIYERLTKECIEEREKLKVLLERMETEQGDFIENLDAALQVLAEIGERYTKCVLEQQRAILLQMVERVILTAEGRIRQIEWKLPFCYIQSLQDDNQNDGQNASKKTKKGKTSRVAAGSLPSSFGALTGLLRHKTRSTVLEPHRARFIRYSQAIISQPT